MNSIAKKVELLANVSIIVVALLIGAVLVKRYLLPAAPASVPQERVLKGTKVSLPDVDWAKNNQTLLVVVSNTCHFCTESAPFYQRLVRDTEKRQDVRLVAVLPQDVHEGKGYLDSLGVQIQDVKQASLSSLGVRGTPTLLLVDNQGVVKESWVGKLPPDQESSVLKHL